MRIVHNENKELVDAAFVRDDELTKNVGELQYILYTIDDSNFDECAKKIENISPKSPFFSFDLARNIIRYSCFKKTQIPLFVRLVSYFSDKSDILEKIDQLIRFELMIGAESFLLSLIEAKLLNDEYKSVIEEHKILFTTLNERTEQEKQLEKIIEQDNVTELENMFAFPDFDINMTQEFNVPHLFYSLRKAKLSLVEFSALNGSIKCFKYLFINGAQLAREKQQDNDFMPLFVMRNLNIMSLAIAGGNIDIIQLLEHSNIHPVDADINDSIQFHHQEIFDWLVEQFPEKLNDEEISNACVENEFVHGIFMISKLSPRLSLKSSSKYGFISLTKFLLLISILMHAIH